MKKKGSCGLRGDRKMIEKNRRIRMKGLCIKLASLIPPTHLNPSKEFLPLQDRLERAAGYIKGLRDRIEELRTKKKHALMQGANRPAPLCVSDSPILKITDLGPNLEVVLITGHRKNFMVHEIVTILQQEGTEVITVTLSNACHKIIHTFHAKVKHLRIGVDASRIRERMEKLINHASLHV